MPSRFDMLQSGFARTAIIAVSVGTIHEGERAATFSLATVDRMFAAPPEGPAV